MRKTLSSKRFILISVFLILPILLISLGSSFSSLARVYVSSGEFVFSIILGALVTSSFYAQYVKNKVLKIGLISIFGVLVPLLYINAAYEVYGSGIREFSVVWSPIYFVTSLIGSVQIILYVGILITSLFRMIEDMNDA